MFPYLLEGGQRWILAIPHHAATKTVLAHPTFPEEPLCQRLPAAMDDRSRAQDGFAGIRKVGNNDIFTPSFYTVSTIPVHRFTRMLSSGACSNLTVLKLVGVRRTRRTTLCHCMSRGGNRGSSRATAPTGWIWYALLFDLLFPSISLKCDASCIRGSPGLETSARH